MSCASGLIATLARLVDVRIRPRRGRRHADERLHRRAALSSSVSSFGVQALGICLGWFRHGSRRPLARRGRHSLFDIVPAPALENIWWSL